VDREAERELREATADFGLVFWLEAGLLVVIALLLWPLGQLRLAFSLAKGMGLFYLLNWVVGVALAVLYRRFRFSLDDHGLRFLYANLAVSGILMTGWAAFAALAVDGAAEGAPVWRAAILYVIGLFSVHMAYTVLSLWYSGTFYRYRNLPLGAAAFALFALWPPAARFLFGWFFGVW
jgi:hypothetical protein